MAVLAALAWKVESPWARHAGGAAYRRNALRESGCATLPCEGRLAIQKTERVTDEAKAMDGEAGWTEGIVAAGEGVNSGLRGREETSAMMDKRLTSHEMLVRDVSEHKSETDRSAIRKRQQNEWRAAMDEERAQTAKGAVASAMTWFLELMTTKSKAAEAAMRWGEGSGERREGWVWCWSEELRGRKETAACVMSRIGAIVIVDGRKRSGPGDPSGASHSSADDTWSGPIEQKAKDQSRTGRGEDQEAALPEAGWRACGSVFEVGRSLRSQLDLTAVGLVERDSIGMNGGSGATAVEKATSQRTGRVEGCRRGPKQRTARTEEKTTL